MEYRGKNCLVFRGDEPDSLNWPVTLVDRTTMTGEARSRAAALRRPHSDCTPS